MEDFVRGLWARGTKVKSSAHNQKGYGDYLHRTIPGICFLKRYIVKGCFIVSCNRSSHAVHIYNFSNVWCNKNIFFFKCEIVIHWPDIHEVFTFIMARWNLFSISYVESESISLKNLKRRSEFFETGKRHRQIIKYICADRLKAGSLWVNTTSWWLPSLCFGLWEAFGCIAFSVTSQHHVSIPYGLSWMIFFHGTVLDLLLWCLG